MCGILSGPAGVPVRGEVKENLVWCCWSSLLYLAFYVHLPFHSLPGPFSFFPSPTFLLPLSPPSPPRPPLTTLLLPPFPLPGYLLPASCQDPLLRVLSKCPQVSLENSFRCCLDSLLGRSKGIVLLTAQESCSSCLLYVTVWRQQRW